MSVNEYQLRQGLKSGPKIHFDHLEGVDEVDPTMARKINMCNFNDGSTWQYIIERLRASYATLISLLRNT